MAKAPATPAPSIQVPKLAAARYKTAKQFPYFSSALWAMSFVPVENLKEKAGGVVACDKYYRMYFDPKHVEETDIAELVSDFYHELGHLLRGHHDRAEHLCKMQGLDVTKGNVKQVINACEDAEINDDMVGFDGIRLRDSDVTPAKLGKAAIGAPFADGLMWEQYFDLIPQKKNPGNRSGGNCQNPGQQQPGDSDSNSGDSSDESNSLGGQTLQKNLDGQRNCGSVASGGSNPWDLPKDSAEAPGVSPAEANLIEKQVAREVQAAAKQQGNIPAGWKRWANAKLEIAYDPRKDLTASIRFAVAEVSGKLNFTWKKFSRRSDALKLLPGMIAPVPNVAVVLDTSGSMDDIAVAEGMELIAKTLKAFGNKVAIDVICVDAAVHSAQKVFNKNKVHVAGGGGTDMRIGLRAAMKRKPKPHIVILVTDGYTPWPAKAFGAKFIVALAGKNNTSENIPSFAKTVWLTGKPKR